MKQIRKRITYANVMSSIAVFLVLGGGAGYAAKKIGSNEIKSNSITTGKIKKEAVTTSKIKTGSISTDKIANDAVTGDKVKESTLSQVPSAASATSATNAASLGGKPASEYTVRYFARVKGEGAVPTLAAGSPGVSVDSTRPFTGAARVIFPVDMTNCAINATYFSGGGTVLVPRQSSISEGNKVVIVLETPTGTGTNGDFNVVGVC